MEITPAMERAAGIEPAPRAWKARVIPFHHARVCATLATGWRIIGQGHVWLINPMVVSATVFMVGPPVPNGKGIPSPRSGILVCAILC